MPNSPTRNVSPTAELTAYTRIQVASGHSSKASEVVRAGLRLMIERDIALTGRERPYSRMRASTKSRRDRHGA